MSEFSEAPFWCLHNLPALSNKGSHTVILSKNETQIKYHLIIYAVAETQVLLQESVSDAWDIEEPLTPITVSIQNLVLSRVNFIAMTCYGLQIHRCTKIMEKHILPI